MDQQARRGRRVTGAFFACMLHKEVLLGWAVRCDRVDKEGFARL
jgi:hypothetical protein